MLKNNAQQLILVVGRHSRFTESKNYLYVYTPPRPLDEIEADITKLEGEIAELLKGLVG